MEEMGHIENNSAQSEFLHGIAENEIPRLSVVLKKVRPQVKLRAGIARTLILKCGQTKHRSNLTAEGAESR
jgi:hypothetical protein